jgi:Arc/MetJ-type ribon-helix-helix transcriptional regulator
MLKTARSIRILPATGLSATGVMSSLRKTVAKRRFSKMEEARIRAHSLAEGIEFRVFLPSNLADWLRAQVEAGVYSDVKEAAFVAFQELRDLTEHPAVRTQLLSAVLRARLDGMDANPALASSIEDVRARLAARQEKWARTAAPKPRPLPVPRRKRPAAALIEKQFRPKSLK